MKNIKKYDEFVNELFVYGQVKEGDYVLLCKSKVWIFSEDDFDVYEKEIRKELKLRNKLEDLYELKNMINDDELPHIVLGYIERPYLVIASNTDVRPARTSPDIQKLLKALKLEDIKIEYTDSYDSADADFVDYKDDEKSNNNNLKNEIFYHGTCIEYLNGILKNGLIPINNEYSKGKTNYDKINHIDKIFTTLNKEKALYHSINSARVNNSFPIIIEHRIPDVDKLDLDYDMGIMYYGLKDKNIKRLGYDKIYKKSGSVIKSIDIKKKTGINNINSKLGVYSYLGRIPSSYIKGILIDLESYRDFYLAQEFGESFDLDVNLKKDISYYDYIGKSDILNRLRSEVDDDDYNYEDDNEDNL